MYIINNKSKRTNGIKIWNTYFHICQGRSGRKGGGDPTGHYSSELQRLKTAFAYS